MPTKSSKQTSVQQLTMVLNGGLNYSQSAANITDNELKRARNFIYDSATDTLITRPGTTCITAVAQKLSTIDIGYYYKNATDGYHIAARGTKLYYLNTSFEWVEIGTNVLTGLYVPSFLTFNTLLLVADGSAHIHTWSGVGGSYTTITDSPAATALTIIKNRVVVNDISAPDAVLLSAPFDALTGTFAWNTSSAAVGLRAGYGDLMNVNAFAVFGDDLIISKVGVSAKRLYRLNMADSTPTNWFIQDLSKNNASQNAHTMIGTWNNVYFVDSNGFKTLKGTQAYGDLEVDAIGRKINAGFTPGNYCDGVVYLPSYNAIWFNNEDRVFCYTERNDPQSGSNIPALTDIVFNWGRITSAYEAGNTTYLTGYNGYLYKLDELVDTDESTPGVKTHFTAAVRTKTLTFFVDGILRKLEWYLNPKYPGTGTLYVCVAENSKITLQAVTPVQEGQYLCDATGFFTSAPSSVDITNILYDTGTSPWIQSSRNRVRSKEMAFELELTSGRCGIQWCKAEIALVEGGE